MNTMKNFFILLLLFLSIHLQAAQENISINTDNLIKPKSMTIDASLDKATADQMLRAAQLFYTFWNTGDEKFLNAVVSPNFIDNTLPNGRPQGPTGLKLASKNFRKAVPDLTCSVEDLLIVGDKITARLLFNGTFTGEFNGHKGTKKPIQFFAIDILHIKDGRLIEDWHLEDNLTLLLQLNAAKILK